MANHLSVYVYRRNQYDLTNPDGTPATSGVLFSLPTVTLQVQPTTVVANVLLQPFASFTVTVYVPAARLLKTLPA
jgi:hypothetical protein